MLAFHCVGAINAADTLTDEQLEFFESKIRPVLNDKCYRCHSNKSGKMRGGLRLDTKLLTHIGGDEGPAVVPGDLQESLLYQAIIYADLEMPPKRQLPSSVIEDFRQWIAMGAPDPRVTELAVVKTSITKEDIQEARENFWAYQQPVKTPSPEVANTEWSSKKIDRFVLAGIEEIGLNPAADALPFQVIRRLCFDLIGLPPTPDQVSYFGDMWQKNPDNAVSYVVDKLLEKKQFGERWGRHWLDVARYAESTGNTVNMTYPHAWRYRDYVIDSFNNDKPYDQFIREQIAGDLLPAKTDQQWADNLIATGFLAMGTKNVSEESGAQFAADLVDEQINATTRLFLGKTISCARCHDHKFDPITQKDYYALAGIFESTNTYYGNPPSDLGRSRPIQAPRLSTLILLPIEDPNSYDKRYTQTELNSLKEEIQTLRYDLQVMRREVESGRSQMKSLNSLFRAQNQLADLTAKFAVVDGNGNPRTYCMGVQDLNEPRDAQLLVRGEIDNPADTVPRGFPQVLRDEEISIQANSSGRLELAQWIASKDNPLTARVMVNRIWKHLIGQGIVTSTEDFGVSGQAPSHPQLLDYLAVRFIESGWSVKNIIREIATSRIYRASSTFNEKAHEYDPDNSLLWRANPRRLDAEAIRDAVLHISGEIDLQRPRGSEVAKGGYVRVRDGLIGGGRQSSSMMGSGRMQSGGRSSRAGYKKGVNIREMVNAKFRSVYLPIVRDEIPRSLKIFDFPDATLVTGSRESSNTVNQALYLMNNLFVIQQSEAFAKRLARERAQLDEQMELAFLLAYSRLPTNGELRATQNFVNSYGPNMSTQEEAELLSLFCQSLYSSAEFRYID